MASTPTVKQYVGHGQSGVWNDPLNWANGSVPGAADTAFVGQSAVLNGPISVKLLMLLGAETITVNGALQTLSTNTCESFMVCDDAVVNFTAGSSLTDAGGFECGINDVGTVNVAGASGGKAAAIINTRLIKIGQFANGTGTVNIAGVLNNAGNTSVGTVGQGTLNFTGAGQGNLAGLIVGDFGGGTGTLTLSGTAAVHADYVTIGSSAAGAPGGIGHVAIGSGTLLSSNHVVAVSYGSSVTMAGGTLYAGSLGNGMQIKPGGSISGFGTLASTAFGICDNGAVTASGGTLTMEGNLTGMGTLSIGAGATLNLAASKINFPGIAFVGPGGTLGLAEGVAGTFSIAGFAAGDQIVMGTIDAVSWSGATDVLSVSDHGHVMDKLILTGVASDAVFQVTPGSHGSVISLATSVAGALHH